MECIGTYSVRPAWFEAYHIYICVLSAHVVCVSLVLICYGLAMCSQWARQAWGGGVGKEGAGARRLQTRCRACAHRPLPPQGLQRVLGATAAAAPEPERLARAKQEKLNSCERWGRGVGGSVSLGDRV